MALAGFEKYTEDMVGVLNYPVDSMYLKILSTMSVRVISALGLCFLTERRNVAFLFHSNTKLDSSKQMTS